MTTRVFSVFVLLAAGVSSVVCPHGAAAQVRGDPEEVRLVSVTDDGIPDSLLVGETTGGSGWTQSSQCVVDGASGTKVCRTRHATSYSPFTGIEFHSSPSTSTERKLARFLRPECEPADSTRPSQASMWRLAHSTAKNLTWHSGRPQRPADVCLSIDEATPLASSAAWNAEGAPVEKPGRWLIRYSSFWQTRAGRHDSLEAVVRAKDFIVYQWRHSLAIYLPDRDRHAWFLNKAAPQGAFKVDRRDRIAEVRSSRDALEVDVRTDRVAAPNTLQIDLDRLLR